MANRNRKSPPQPIILNDDTRSWWVDQGKLAEGLFQHTREDRLPPAPMTDAEWRSLLRDLSVSCRKTAELMARYKATWPSVSEKPARPRQVRRALTDPEWEKLRQDPYFGFIYLLDSLHAFWDGAEQSVGGVDKGLELFAQYCDIMRARPRGRRRDHALTHLIQAKLVAWLAMHGDSDICHWNPSEDRYDGGFLDEMEQTLQRLEYEYPSRGAIAQRIKAVQKKVVVYVSEEKAVRAIMDEVQKERQQGAGSSQT